MPEALGGTRTLSNFPYRGATLNITVSGYGDKVKGLTVNGKSYYPEKGKVIPAKLLKGNVDIHVEMNNEPIEPMKVNHVANLKAPLTPIAWLTTEDGRSADAPALNLLQWNPIEYIGEYIVLRDGEEVGRTHQTSWPALTEGEWQVIGVASDGTRSFASEPRSNRLRKAFEPGGEQTSLKSAEVSYPSAAGVKGWHGNGFAETDSKTPVTTVIDTEAAGLPEGVYTISFRYANGNGPVNTENKAAIRSLYVDGKDAGTIVMPQRGVANWDDWGESNSVRIELAPGRHELKLVMNPEDSNMNLQTNHAIIDRVILEKVK